MVRAESRPISSDTGLNQIEKRAFDGVWERTGSGTISELDCYQDFVQHLLNIVPGSVLKPLRVLADAGNGAAGVAMDQLIPHLPLDVTRRHYEPDGHFPNGVPNPILEESRAGTEAEMRANSYDFGVAWDGDYDRCFFFDEHGTFIEGYYIVGLLAQSILADGGREGIVYDPRLYWNTLDIISSLDGRAVMCKSGHAFIKEKMRAEDCTYGGEMSAHHYFKAHWYCDSGMIPFLLVAKLVSQTGKSLGELVGQMIANYPCSGEVNSHVSDVAGTIAKIEGIYGPQGTIEKVDGLSIDLGDWRFNLRGSNTEPVIRLNVEARGDAELMRTKTDELVALIRG